MKYRIKSSSKAVSSSVSGIKPTTAIRQGALGGQPTITNLQRAKKQYMVVAQKQIGVQTLLYPLRHSSSHLTQTQSCKTAGATRLRMRAKPENPIIQRDIAYTRFRVAARARATAPNALMTHLATTPHTYGHYMQKLEQKKISRYLGDSNSALALPLRASTRAYVAPASLLVVQQRTQARHMAVKKLQHKMVVQRVMRGVSAKIAESQNQDQQSSSVESRTMQAVNSGYYRATVHLHEHYMAKKTARLQAQLGTRTSKLRAATNFLAKKLHLQSVLERYRGSALAGIVRGITTPLRTIRAIIQALPLVGSALIVITGGAVLLGLLSMFTLSSIAATPMGITMASDAGDPYTPLSEICASIDQGAQDKLDAIRKDNPHDREILTGNFMPWNEVLSVFAVWMTTRTDGLATHVAAFDEPKTNALYDFYWKNNAIAYRVEATPISPTQSIRILYITISSKTQEQMEQSLFFTQEQKRLVQEVSAQLQSTGGGNIVYQPAGTPMTAANYAALIGEAERHLGAPYKLGTTNAPYEFDCGYFVQYVFNKSGVAQIGVRRATQLFYLCKPISPTDAAPGDLIFFRGTYDTTTLCSHVGIYVGNNTMIHSGSPVKYSRIDTPYWQAHFYAFGRIIS